MTHIEPQMIEVQPLNNLADIPLEIWIAMVIQLALIVLVLWLLAKLISKISTIVTKLIRATKTDTTSTDEAAALLDADWSDIEDQIKKENGK